MTILVTRPKQESVELCYDLHQLGYNTVCHPLIDIHPGGELSHLSTLFSSLTAGDMIIAVSQHAIVHAQHYLQQNNIPWPKDVHYITVGEKSAQCFSLYIQNTIHYPAISDSEHLLELSILNDIKNRKIVILRGNGGRELIYQTLNGLGAHVVYCETYQRKNILFNAVNKTQEWQNKKVDTIVITSGEQLSFFTSLFSESQLAWINQCRLLVPSKRIGKLAKELGYQNVKEIGGASNIDFLNYITQYN